MISFSNADRADPLAAGLDQILGPVDQPQVAQWRDARDVTSAQPPVRGGTARRAPSPVRKYCLAIHGPRHSKLTGGLVVPRQFSSRVSASTMRISTPGAAMPAVAAQIGQLLDRRQIGKLRAHRAHRTQRRELGHAPGLGDRQADLEPPRFGQRLRGLADPPQMIVRNEPTGRARRAVRTMPIQIVGTPAVIVTRSASSRLTSAAGEQIGSGHDQRRAGHAGGVGPKAPRVRVEHRYDQGRIRESQASRYPEDAGVLGCDRVQPGRTVRVNDALRVAGRACRGATDRSSLRAFVLDVAGIDEVDRLGGRGDQLLVTDRDARVIQVSRSVAPSSMIDDVLRPSTAAAGTGVNNPQQRKRSTKTASSSA